MRQEHDTLRGMSTKATKLNTVIKRIEPLRDYNLSHIKDEGLFPWAKNIRTVRKIVHQDKVTENVLKAVITGEGRALDYKIKGRNISKFLEKYGPGFMLATPGK